MDRNTMKKQVIGCLAALSLVSLAVVAADGQQPAPDGKAVAKAAQARIDAQRKAQEQACRPLRGNAADVCRAEARARAAVALAALKAQRKPAPEAAREVRKAQAEADYKVARERCGAAEGDARKACLRQAKDSRAAALRMAAVEKVQAQLRQKAGAREREGTARGKTPQERYASLKAFCETRGTEREQCLADVKRQFGRS